MEFNDEAINFVKRRLPKVALKTVYPFKLMVIFPINVSQFQIGPVLDRAFGQP